MMSFPIIYEDQDILVLNKPPGVVVNQAQTVTTPTIMDWAVEQVTSGKWPEVKNWQELIPSNFKSEFGTPEEIWQERHGIVHRLDKETSGALILAKHPGALVHLLAQFKQRQTTKKYQCLVHGKCTVPSDTITAPIARASHNRLQFGVDPTGREASTFYQVLAYYPHLDIEKIVALPSAQGKNFKKRAQIYQGFSLVECSPKTGRTHQIRVHLAHINHPLVGDATYAGKKRKAVDPLWCPRHFLHASQLTITHPRTNQPLTFTAPLTPDLTKVLEYLREN